MQVLNVGDSLTIEQLARYTGEPEERLRDWRSRGIIGHPDTDTLTLDDVERAQVVQLLLRRGIAFEKVADAVGMGLLDGYQRFLLPETAAAEYSLAEAAEIVGMDVDLLRRIVDAAGWGGRVLALTDQEIQFMRNLKVLAQLGIPQEAVLQTIRVYVDALGRVADAEQSLFRFYVYPRLLAAGLSGSQLAEASERTGEQLFPLIEPAILYFHRLALLRAVREDIVIHLAEEAGLVAKSEAPGEVRAAIVFIDLSSFTPLAEAMGDVAAAGVLERFSRIVRSATAAWSGRVVKQIGDAFMLVFPDARSAVACALEIESRAAKEPQFPAVRAGIHWGSVLYREGDYVGSNVNIASRLANEAQRHQVIVTAEVRKEAHDLPEIEFVRLGKRQLKGLSGKFDLFEVRSSAAPAAEKAVDPVCGMELGPGEITARLSLEGAERAFCSEACLRKFVAAPESYA